MSKSAAQAAWESQLTEVARERPEMAYVEDDPALPRVLLIGDSISMGYTLPVRGLLAGKANVHRPPANCGETRTSLGKIDDWLEGGRWDLIHFNWGLHDIKHLKDGVMDVAGVRAISIDEYGQNLGQLVDRMRATDAALIWASTTPVPEGAAGRVPGHEVETNAVAAAIMAERGIAINDLHALILNGPPAYQMPANVHFTDEGSQFLGETVAAVIVKALADPAD